MRGLSHGYLLVFVLDWFIVENILATYLYIHWQPKTVEGAVIKQDKTVFHCRLTPGQAMWSRFWVSMYASTEGDKEVDV